MLKAWLDFICFVQAEHNRGLRLDMKRGKRTSTQTNMTRPNVRQSFEVDLFTPFTSGEHVKTVSISAAPVH